MDFGIRGKQAMMAAPRCMQNSKNGATIIFT